MDTVSADLLGALKSLEQGKAQRAWIAIQNQLKQDSTDPFILSVAVAALRSLGRVADAERVQDRAARSPLPDFPDGTQLDVMRRLDDLDRRRRKRAVQFAKQAVKFIKQGDAKRAEDLLAQSESADPACALAHFHRGVLAAERGLTAAACVRIVKALRIDSALISAQKALTYLMSSKGPVRLTSFL